MFLLQQRFLVKNVVTKKFPTSSHRVSYWPSARPAKTIVSFPPAILRGNHFL